MEFLKNASTTYLVTAIVYLVSLAYGLNFILSSLSYGLGNGEFLIIFLIVIMPLVFHILYFGRKKLNLENRENTIRTAASLLSVISVLFTIFFIVPISY